MERFNSGIKVLKFCCWQNNKQQIVASMCAKSLPGQFLPVKHVKGLKHTVITLR
jgi:hypothetical protein